MRQGIWRAASAKPVGRLMLATLVGLAVLKPSIAHAATYAMGQCVECDGSNLNKYFKRGVVIASPSK